MGENSGIQWTHHTFNPWVGCQRVSPGCENCYAEAYDKRVGGAVDPFDGVKRLRWGPRAPRVRTSEANWRKPLKWNREAGEAGERHRVFCASLADVFEDRSELREWRTELFALIHATPNLDWLLLTKRPENIDRLWPKAFIGPGAKSWPNIWLGTTVEDQTRANERIPELVKVPAAVRFLSMEPLLEPVDLSYWLEEDKNGFIHRTGNAIQWAIIGGESGSKARPFSLDWARNIVRQCRDGDVAPFVKQMGSSPVEVQLRGHVTTEFFVKFTDHHGGDPAEWPEDLRVREFPR